jgi:hypothetical protein
MSCCGLWLRMHTRLDLICKEDTCSAGVAAYMQTCICVCLSATVCLPAWLCLSICPPARLSAHSCRLVYVRACVCAVLRIHCSGYPAAVCVPMCVCVCAGNLLFACLCTTPAAQRFNICAYFGWCSVSVCVRVCAQHLHSTPQLSSNAVDESTCTP